MSIKPIPNQGLRVAEPEYLPLKAYQSGGFYWDGEAQKVIRSILGDFLPPLIQDWPDGRRTGLFQLFEGSLEVLCESRQASQRNPIPARQLELLSRSLEDFKRKAESPETTPNNRHIIQQFKLPDFDRDPDLYRISGGYWNRRLHVLWGCERAAESSLSPAAALAKLPSTGAFNIPKKYMRWLAALIGLLLLLLLLWWLWPPSKHDISVVKEVQPPAMTPPEPPKPSADPPNPVNQDPSSSKDGVGGSNGSGVPGLGNGGNGSSAPSPPGGDSPQASVPASPATGKSPNKDGTKRPAVSDKPSPEPKFKTPNPSASGLEIEKSGPPQILPNERIKVVLELTDHSGSGKIPEAESWKVDGKTDGINHISANKIFFSCALVADKHNVTVTVKDAEGNVVEKSSWLTIKPDFQLETVK